MGLFRGQAMKWRISVLCENSVGPISGTLGEHGFAALIEGDSDSVLFDTGQGLTLLHNAKRMNKDLRRVERVALSHGHYDHTGGLMPLLEQCGPKLVHAHPDVFQPRYRVKDTGEHIPIGLPHTEESLRHAGARFDCSSGFREIGSGLFLTGEVPRATSFEHGDTGLYCDVQGCRPDQVVDDQSLIVQSEKGLVVILGCCHAGIVNTLHYVIHKTGKDEFYAIIGGTHLGFCSALQLDETVKRLHEFRIRKFFGSHCTGFAAAGRLSREFAGQYHPAQVGFTLEI